MTASIIGQRRRLIVSSYCFPPDNSVGARRWAKFAEILSNWGWELDVIACAPPGARASEYKYVDGVSVHLVPQPRILRAEAEQRLFTLIRSVHRARSESPRDPPSLESQSTDVAQLQRGWELGSLRGWKRLHWALAEVARGEMWGRQSTRVLSGIVQRKRPLAIISSAPPHAAHTPISIAAKSLGIPFVLDMRDPWSLAEGLPDELDTPMWRNRSSGLERACVARAALVVANTPAAATSLREHYPAAAHRIVAVLNGSDDDSVPAPPEHREFVVAYAGTVYTDRDPRQFLRGAAIFIRRNNVPPDKLKIRFMGDFGPDSGCPIDRIAAEEGVGAYVETLRRQPREIALQFLASAAVLVTFPGFNSVSIPAKVYECIRFPAWLLALSPAGSATHDLLAGSEARVIEPSQVNCIAGCLGSWYEAFERGVRPTQPVPAGKFSRTEQAELLVAELSRLAGD